jgi:hypothetical protein
MWVSREGRRSILTDSMSRGACDTSECRIALDVVGDDVNKNIQAVMFVK